MNLDVRIPIGLMFTLLGLLLTGYGVATLGEAAARPTGLPIDLIWGIVMLMFGVAMLLLFRRGRSAAVPGEPGADGPPKP
jgi:hypothetical protein